MLLASDVPDLAAPTVIMMEETTFVWSSEIAVLAFMTAEMAFVFLMARAATDSNSMGAQFAFLSANLSV